MLNLPSIWKVKSQARIGGATSMNVLVQWEVEGNPDRLRAIRQIPGLADENSRAG